MPYRQWHNCLLNEAITNIVEIRDLKTQWGMLKQVMGTDEKGNLVERSLRIPATVPVREAQNICQIRQGKFQPATPLDPRRELLSKLTSLSQKRKRKILASFNDYEFYLEALEGLKK